MTTLEFVSCEECEMVKAFDCARLYKERVIVKENNGEKHRYKTIGCTNNQEIFVILKRTN